MKNTITKITKMKNTITKALILFVALITTTSLLASENIATEEVVCAGAKSFILSDSGDEQITRIVVNLNLITKPFLIIRKWKLPK